MRLHYLAALTTIAILAGGVAALGAESGGGAGGNAAKAEYKPPPCPKGQHPDPKTGACVPDKPSRCPKGQHVSATTGDCEDDGPCRPGQHVSPILGLGCVPDHKHKLPPTPEELRDLYLSLPLRASHMIDVIASRG